jgi:hypothetical protein
VALPVVVHLSSQRTLVPVRQDGCFAEKQEPHPALLLIVLSGHEIGGAAGCWSPGQSRRRGPAFGEFHSLLGLQALLAK